MPLDFFFFFSVLPPWGTRPRAQQSCSGGYTYTQWTSHWTAAHNTRLWTSFYSHSSMHRHISSQQTLLRPNPQNTCQKKKHSDRRRTTMKRLWDLRNYLQMWVWCWPSGSGFEWTGSRPRLTQLWRRSAWKDQHHLSGVLWAPQKTY